MRYLVAAFLLCGLLLVVLVSRQHDASPFADGHLSCLPLPAALPRAARPAEELSPSVLARLEPPSAPAAIAATKLEFAAPEAQNEKLLEVRNADQSDWGIPNLPMPEPVVVASVPAPRAVKPATDAEIMVETSSVLELGPVTSETVAAALMATSGTQASVVPNLYLPEGAQNEAEALLTLIKSEMQAHEQASDKSPASPFTLHEGDRIRPLTRLRNEKEFDWVKFERDGKVWWAKAEYFIRINAFAPQDLGLIDLPIGEEEVARDSSLPRDYRPSDLVTVPSATVLGGKEIKLRRETSDALQRMIAAAARKGLTLRAFSGYRDFDHQKRLYLEAIDQTGPKQNGVAEPGFSEHQLGTTVDICNRDSRYIMTEAFGHTAEGKWLQENADKYGFRFSYTSENSSESGYRPEPWHLRYVGATATEPPARAVAKGR